MKVMKTAFQKVSMVAALAILTVPMFAKSNNVPRDLRDAVRHELVMLPYYSVFDNFEYKVDNGTVTLYGEVTRPVLKSDAEHVVKHIPGVVNVISNIKVLPLSPFDNQIRAATY